MRLRSGIRTVVGAGLAVFAGAAAADAQQTALRDLKVGDVAPVFEGLADNGQKWSSEQGRKGGLLVVYFYPAAMTGGCTAQACMFRDDRTKLLDMGAEVVGVSGDRIANLKAFKGSNRLNFPLLSDTAGTIARAFGVPTSQGGTIKREVEGYSMWHRRRLSMRPGLTGLWQVQARHDLDFDRRATLDLDYVDSWSLWMDLKILLRTIPAIVQSPGR